MTTNEAAFRWDDPLLLDEELTDEERLVRDTARDYCRREADAAGPRRRTGRSGSTARS